MRFWTFLTSAAILVAVGACGDDDEGTPAPAGTGGGTAGTGGGTTGTGGGTAGTGGGTAGTGGGTAGTGGGTAGTGGGGDVCDNICAKIVSVGCPTDSLSTCGAGCAQLRQEGDTLGCLTEADALLACGAAAPTTDYDCDANGEAKLNEGACSAEVSAMLVCATP